MNYGPAMKMRVLALYDQALATKAVAERLLVWRAYARRVKQHRHRPAVAPRPRPRKLDTSQCEKLVGFVAERPDATLDELRRRVELELKVTISVGCLFNTLRRLKLSLKKSRRWPVNRRGPMSPRPVSSSWARSSKTCR